jgi:hypothetical protein
MGKIYNGMDMNVAETDSTPKELEEIFDILNNIGSFVVERDDVKFRDDEIKRIYNILRKYLYKNVLLVGDYGSGKRSIVEGYCNYLLERGDDEMIFKLDFPEILKMATNPNEFDKIVSDIFYIAGNYFCNCELSATTIFLSTRSVTLPSTSIKIVGSLGLTSLTTP